jgi:hypothetical protein
VNRYRSEETMPGPGDRHGPDRWDDEPLTYVPRLRRLRDEDEEYDRSRDEE